MMSIFDPTRGSYSLGRVLLRRNTLYKYIHVHVYVSGSVSCFDIVCAHAYVFVSDDVCLCVRICVGSRVRHSSSHSTPITPSKEPTCHVTNWACTCAENGDVAHSRHSLCLFLFFFLFFLSYWPCNVVQCCLKLSIAFPMFFQWYLNVGLWVSCFLATDFMYPKISCNQKY